jgi:hypothetical protein
MEAFQLFPLPMGTAMANSVGPQLMKTYHKMHLLDSLSCESDVQ